MARWALVAVLVSACSHDVGSLRGTGAGSDSGVVRDAGPGRDGGRLPDARPVDAPIGCSVETLFESATAAGAPTDGLLLGDGIMRYWRFEVRTPVDVTALGVNAKLDMPTLAVELRLGVFTLTDSTDVPNDVAFGADLVVDATASVATITANDLDGPTALTTLAAGWYAIGVVKSGSDAVRVTHGHTDLGSIRPATLTRGGTSTQGGNSRLFVRGCRP